QQTVAELRDKLIAAMVAGEYSLEEQLNRVFDAFRDGLAQRLAWLATVDPGGSTEGTQMIMRDIADTLHSRRTAKAPPGTTITRNDTDALIHLVATAALGDALYGTQLRRSAGLPATSETECHFRQWLCAMIRAHSTRRGGE